jgi:peroxiredoxin
MPILSLLAAVSALLGQPVPDWPAKTEAQWVQGGPLDLEGLRGKVVLIRFFTGTTCPYCSATARR